LLFKLTPRSSGEAHHHHYSSPASAKATDRATARILEKGRDALDFDTSEAPQRAQSLDSAFLLLRELILRRNQTLYLPGVFNILILGCVRNGQVERAMDTMQLCCLSGVLVSKKVRQQVQRLRVRAAAQSTRC
jgi:pentatricopeptide repeat protein